MNALENPPAGGAVPPLSSPHETRDFWRGLHRLAEPKLALPTLSALVLGAGAAGHAGRVEWFWLALTLLGLWCIEVAKNAAGEIFDLDSGVDLAAVPEDRSPFPGGRHVLADGLLTPGQTWLVAVSGFLLATCAGVWIVFVHEPRVLGLGLAGVALAFFYHAPPLRLSYRGLGETAVALAYGPMMVAGVFLVQRGTVPLWLALAGVPLGLLIAAFQAVNEFPEAGEDRAAHKHTLVVRLGPADAARVVAAMVAAAFVITLLLPLAGAPLGMWGGLVAIVSAAQAVRLALAYAEEPVKLAPAQAQAEWAFLLYALGAGTGLALS
jgi:1,4-dihydroxy-2-naphthoate octaprenyltransferase